MAGIVHYEKGSLSSKQYFNIYLHRRSLQQQVFSLLFLSQPVSGQSHKKDKSAA